MALVLVPFLGAAVITDMLRRSVPNVLVGLMFVFGIVVQFSFASSAGGAILASFGGAVVGLVILLPFYMIGGMGAGDVKLLAAAGSFFGPQAALAAGAFTLVAGAVLGLIVVIGRSLKASLLARRFVRADRKDIAGAQLPYSIAISAGALTVLAQW